MAVNSKSVGAHCERKTMNITELESTRNVTFHDADLRSLTVDYVAQKAVLVLDVWIGWMSDPATASYEERERRRPGRLELTGLQYLVVEPPDPTYPYTNASIEIDPCDADEALSSRYPEPAGVFSGRFFVSAWNSFIHYAAADAELVWMDEERGLEGAE